MKAARRAALVAGAGAGAIALGLIGRAGADGSATPAVAAPAMSASADAGPSGPVPAGSLCPDPGPEPAKPTCQRYASNKTVSGGKIRTVQVPVAACLSDPGWAAADAWAAKKAAQQGACVTKLCSGQPVSDACSNMPPASVLCPGGQVRAVSSCPAHATACPVGMVGLRGGTFTMGDRHDTVTVESLCMDVTEVTITAYASCVTAGACTEPTPYVADGANKFDRACNWKRPGAGLHPVNCVDWGQATSYCGWAGKRLPTEEEWEWGARGASQGRTYPWGNDAPTADRVNACGSECVAWGKSNIGVDWKAVYAADDGWPTTSPVGSFARGATPQGLQDMAGNVWEWTSSNYDANTRVNRGGSWYDDDASFVRAADRGWSSPSYRGSILGFRCAR